MRKNKIKEYSFYDESWHTDISYLFGGTVEDLMDFIYQRHKGMALYSWGVEHIWGKDANTTNAYQFHVNAPLGDGERFYVWLHEMCPNLLCHETVHLVGDILFTRGMEYKYESEEAYAYLAGNLFEKIYNLLNGKISPKK